MPLVRRKQQDSEASVDHGLSRRRRNVSDEGAVASQPGAFGRLRRSEAFAGYMFLLPNFLGFLAFSLIPIFAAFALTFASWNLVGTPQFVGLSNYKQMVGDRVVLDDSSQHRLLHYRGSAHRRVHRILVGFIAQSGD